MPPTDPPEDPRATALARDTERLTRRVDATDGKVGELDTQVRQLAENVTTMLEQQEATAPRAWLHVDDADKARRLLADLVGWLDAVYLRYPGAALPACWLWHPHVVEELWWLRGVHRDAYEGRGASWQKAGEWHDRYRPRVVERIRDAIDTCDLHQHLPGREKSSSPITAPLAGHVDVVAEAWTSIGVPPEPTSEQIEQAQALDDEKLRSTS